MKQNDNDTVTKPEAYAGSDSYSYVSGTDRIDSITGKQDFNYSYDAEGNITSDGVREFTYNQDNRLKEVNMGGLTQYVYNGKGQRVKKDVHYFTQKGTWWK
jgi:hypothetical protein